MILSTELLCRAPEALASVLSASLLILIETVDIRRILPHNFLKFILLPNKIPSSLFGDVSTPKLIIANPDNDLITALKWHLAHGIGNAESVAYLVAIVSINDNVVSGDDRIAAAVYGQIDFKLKILVLP